VPQPTTKRFIIELFFSITLLALLLSLMQAGPASANSKASLLAEPNALELTSVEMSKEGYFVLRSNTAPAATTWQLERWSAAPTATQLNNQQPLALYPWPANTQQLTLSGFANGTYYFRLRASNNNYSNVVKVQVDHYPLWQALSLFSLGLGLFVIVVVVIAKGAYRSANATEEPL